MLDSAPRLVQLDYQPGDAGRSLPSGVDLWRVPKTQYGHLPGLRRAVIDQYVSRIKVA